MFDDKLMSQSKLCNFKTEEPKSHYQKKKSKSHGSWYSIGS